MYRRCVDLCAGSYPTRRLVLAVQDSGGLDLAWGSADLVRQVSGLVLKLVGSTDLATEIVG